jgi:predicted transcriptional regulator
MEFDSFLGTPRWRILEIVAKQPASPLEISNQIRTSVSYVSQQLKLLEVARIVEKHRTGKVDRGQPRNLFSLVSEFVYFTALIKGSSSKKMLPLTKNHKSILAIWLLENEDWHYPLEKFYWGIEEELDSVKLIAVDTLESTLKLIIASDDKKFKVKAETLAKRLGRIHITFVSESQVSKYLNDNYTLIHILSNDPAGKNEVTK